MLLQVLLCCICGFVLFVGMEITIQKGLSCSKWHPPVYPM